MKDRLTEETRLKKEILRLMERLLTMSPRTWKSAGEAVDALPLEETIVWEEKGEERDGVDTVVGTRMVEHVGKRGADEEEREDAEGEERS